MLMTVCIESAAAGRLVHSVKRVAGNPGCLILHKAAPDDAVHDINDMISLSEKYKLKEAAQKADYIRVLLRGGRDEYLE